MPVFQITLDDGRKLRVDAEDQKAALAGVEHFKASEAPQASGGGVRDALQSVIPDPTRPELTTETPPEPMQNPARTMGDKLENFGRAVTPQGPISGLIALMRLAGDASKGKVDLQTDEGINRAIPAVTEGSALVAPSARARPMPRTNPAIAEESAAASASRLSEAADATGQAVTQTTGGIGPMIKDLAPHLALEMMFPSGTGISSYLVKRGLQSALKPRGEPPVEAPPAPAAPVEAPVAAPVAPEAAPGAASYPSPALLAERAKAKAMSEAIGEVPPPYPPPMPEAPAAVPKDVVANARALSRGLANVEKMKQRSGAAEAPPAPVRIAKANGKLKAAEEGKTYSLDETFDQPSASKPTETSLPESDYADLSVPEAAAKIIAQLKADKPDFKFYHPEKNYIQATERRLTAKEGIAASVAPHVPNVPTQRLRAWLQGAKTRAEANVVKEHLKSLAPNASAAIDKAFSTEGLKAGWKK